MRFGRLGGSETGSRRLELADWPSERIVAALGEARRRAGPVQVDRTEFHDCGHRGDDGERAHDCALASLPSVLAVEVAAALERQGALTTGRKLKGYRWCTWGRLELHPVLDALRRRLLGCTVCFGWCE